MAKEEGSRKRNQTFVQTNVEAVFVGKRKVGIKAELFFGNGFKLLRFAPVSRKMKILSFFFIRKGFVPLWRRRT